MKYNSSRAILLVLFLLTGCGVREVSCAIKIDDVYKVWESKNDMPLSVNLDVEYSSKESCLSNGADLRRRLAQAWSFATLVGCEEVTDGAIGTFKLGTALVYQPDISRPFSDYPLYLGLYEDHGRIALAYMLNQGALISLLMREFDGKAELQEQRNLEGFRRGEIDALSAQLRGRHDRDVDVVIINVFMDDEPVAERREFILSRGTKTEILLSDVATSSLGLTNQALIATFPLP